MEKRTLLTVVLTVVLGLGAYAALRAPDKGERKGPAARLVPVIKAADISKLEIVSQKDEKTTLEKKDGAWRVTSPADWPADATAVKSLTDGIEKLGFGDIVTENAAKQDELGVGDKGAVHLKITTPKGTDELLLGRSIGGFTMVRLPGKTEVWQGTNLFPYSANKAPKDWRDHAVVDLAVADVDHLTVQVPGGSKIAVERVADADPKKAASWKIVESSGDAPKAGEVFDVSQPTTVAQALQSMRASDFADGKSAKDAGLDPPALIVSVAGKGKTQSVELGAAQGDDVYVRKMGEPTIYVVKKYSLDRVMYRPIDYRDKTLLHYKADEIAKLRVVQGKDETVLAQKDGKWQLPSGATDENKARTLIGGAENLQGSGFLTDKTVKPELDKPHAVVTLELKAGGKAVLTVGALTKDSGDYYAQRNGMKDVLLVKKFAIDRLLKKPVDLAPPPPGAARPPGPHPGGPPGPVGPHGH